MKLIIWIVLIGILLFVIPLGFRGLCEPDEGRYAEIAREMIEIENFSEPQLNYIKHFHKPPLVYWLVATSFSIFGINEFTARLPIAIIAILGLFIVFFLAINMGKSKQIAYFSSLILATSIQYFVWSQVLSSDMVFSFFIYLSILGFWIGYLKKSNYMYLLYVGLAFAFLVKGPVALVIVFSIIVIYSLVSKEFIIFKRLKALKGLLLFLLIVSPWFIYVCIKNPGLSKYLILDQTFDRLFTDKHGRDGHMLYFIPVLAIGLLPWIMFLPKIVMKYWSFKEKGKENLFLFLWIVIPLLFFSFSSSKLPGYILPIYPPLAILIASYICEKGYYKIFTVVMASISVILLVGALSLPFYEEDLKGNLSIRKAAKYINENSTPEDIIVNYKCFLQGLPFYVKKRVVLVEKRRETNFNKDSEELSKYLFKDIGDFWDHVDRKNKIWIFCKKKDYKDLINNSPIKLNKKWEKSEFVLTTN